MVTTYPRRRYQRRKPLSKRVVKRRTRLFRKVPRLMNVIAVKRMGMATTPFTVSSASTAGFWNYYSPTVGLCNNFAEFQPVFDLYKVNGIQITFIPRFGQPSFPITGNTPMTMRRMLCTIVKDPQSQLLPGGTYTFANLNTLKEQGGYTVDANKPFSIYWKPKVQLDSTVGAGTYYRNAPWLNTDDVTTPMRGCHVFFHNQGMDSATLGADAVYDIQYTFYLMFKNLR